MQMVMMQMYLSEIVFVMPTYEITVYLNPEYYISVNGHAVVLVYEQNSFPTVQQDRYKEHVSTDSAAFHICSGLHCSSPTNTPPCRNGHHVTMQDGGSCQPGLAIELN